MAKVLRRQDITFEDKDQALRNDVRTLGSMVGELIRDQGGEELFEFARFARRDVAEEFGIELDFEPQIV